VNFIDRFLQYTSGTEVPDAFYVWAGYATVSSAIGRRVWFNLGSMTYYPNLYIMLVGDAGSGKSTAISRARSILEPINEEILSKSIETPEGLWRFMGGDPKADPPVPSTVATPIKCPDGFERISHPFTIFANEFVNFISKDPIGWISAMNDIYEGKTYGYRTKNRGTDDLSDPYLVILGALTTDISTSMQKDEIIKSGFARRTIFQFGERKYHEPHAIPGYVNEEQRQQLITAAQELTKLSGEVTWSPETQVWWTEWYSQHNEAIPNAVPYLKNWLHSKPSQVLKVAMLTALAENPPSLVITRDHLQIAIDRISLCEKDLYKIFGGVGRNELAEVTVRILDFILKQPVPISLPKLNKLFWKDCKPPYDMDACIKYLVDSEQVVRSVYTEGVGNNQRITTILASPEAMAEFVQRMSPPQG
jgi:Protein of unknown function (DUF3987)